MNKISAILSVLAVSAIISCSGSSDSDIERGYIDPEFDTAKTLASKSYSLQGGAYACSSATSCGAIIYTGEVNDTRYTGFAVDNYSTATPFKLKIYWPANLIPSSISNPSGYVVKAVIGSTTYTAASGNLAATITAGTGTGTYTITFTDTLVIGGGALTINNGDTIVAYKYPDE